MRKSVNFVRILHFVKIANCSKTAKSQERIYFTFPDAIKLCNEAKVVLGYFTLLFYTKAKCIHVTSKMRMGVQQMMKTVTTIISIGTIALMWTWDLSASLEHHVMPFPHYHIRLHVTCCCLLGFLLAASRYCDLLSS